jgi:transposase
VEKPRRTYAREFKVEAVRLATQGDWSQGEVTQDVGVPSSCLNRWIEQSAFREQG